jgi:hypothetical protein
MPIRGIMPRPTMNQDNSTNFAQSRFVLREAWNTKYISQLGANQRVLTPFRAVNNAGDLLCRQNYSCGGPSQAPQSRPGLRGLRIGAIFSNCDGTNVPGASCNPKYVYDSSNYTTFLKQKANAKNYNDTSFIGNSYNSSQSALRRAHIY